MWPFRRRRKARRSHPWDTVATEAEQAGTRFLIEAGEGFRLARYEKDGAFDYGTYLRVQTAGNRAKIDKVFADEKFITQIAAHATERLGDVTRVLCHGTRNGAEQKWFKAAFPDAEILGTEISETASRYPMTIEWDFHDVKEGWEDYWDVLYSNSWDHSFSPARMFDAWRRSLRAGGLLYLEHTEAHELVDRLDLYGATPAALRKAVEDQGLTFVESLQSREAPAGRFVRRALVFARMT